MYADQQTNCFLLQICKKKKIQTIRAKPLRSTVDELLIDGSAVVDRFGCELGTARPIIFPLSLLQPYIPLPLLTPLLYIKLLLHLYLCIILHFSSAPPLNELRAPFAGITFSNAVVNV